MVRRLALATAGGALLAAGCPPWNAPYLLPVGFAALVGALERATFWQALCAGMAAGMAHFGGTLFWLGGLFGPAAVFLVAILAAFTALFGVSFACASRRLSSVPLWISAPVLWTGIEAYRSEWFVLRFAWSSLGYAVAACPAPLQLASVAGVYGLSLLVVAFGTALRSAWRRPSWRGPALLLFGVWCALCLARPIRDDLPVRAATIRLVQAAPEDEGALFGMSALRPGVQPAFIVWPDLSLRRDPRDDPRLWRRVQAVARTTGGALVLGITTSAAHGSFRSAALVVGPDGKVLGERAANHKARLVRVGGPGQDARSVATAAGRMGVAICSDLDDPDVARWLTQDGAEAILSPSMNPSEWGPAQRQQHRLLLRTRAVECRRWIASADVGGSSVIVDATGRDRWSARSDVAGRIDGLVGLERGRSPYVRASWLLGPTCLVAALLLMAACLAGAARAAIGRRRASTLAGTNERPSRPL